VNRQLQKNCKSLVTKKITNRRNNILLKFDLFILYVTKIFLKSVRARNLIIVAYIPGLSPLSKKLKTFDETMMKPSPTLTANVDHARGDNFSHHNCTSVNWHFWSTYFVVIWYHYVYILSQVVGSPFHPRDVEHLQQKRNKKHWLIFA